VRHGQVVLELMSELATFWTIVLAVVEAKDNKKQGGWRWEVIELSVTLPL